VYTSLHGSNFNPFFYTFGTNNTHKMYMVEMPTPVKNVGHFVFFFKFFIEIYHTVIFFICFPYKLMFMVTKYNIIVQN
jgi:hypothetical protein